MNIIQYFISIALPIILIVVGAILMTKKITVKPILIVRVPTNPIDEYLSTEQSPFDKVTEMLQKKQFRAYLIIVIESNTIDEIQFELPKNTDQNNFFTVSASEIMETADKLTAAIQREA